MNEFQSMVQSHIEKYKTPMIKGEEIIAFTMKENSVEFSANGVLFVYAEGELEERLTAFLEQFYYENGSKESNLWDDLLTLGEVQRDETEGRFHGGAEEADVEDFFKTVNETGNAPIDNSTEVNNDIGWAKRQLEKGLRVTRPLWIGYIQLFTIQDSAAIMKYTPFGGVDGQNPITIWQPTPADILATDYMLI